MDEYHAAGQHSVLWDGKSDRGEMVSAGVYFCRLGMEAGTGEDRGTSRSSEAAKAMGEQQVRRMVFLK